MPLIKLKTYIKADQRRCFDLARDIDFHQDSLKHTKEKAVAGRISGLIQLGESVTWEATHLGVTQHLTSKITEMHIPHSFIDEMVDGPFKLMKHEHYFNQKGDTTKMVDLFYFESPYGFLGHLVNLLFLKKYLTKLLMKRNEAIKKKAEFK